MAARLGNILYWLGIILAAMVLLEALLDTARSLSGAAPSGNNSGILIGVVICGAGWAARYILRGPQ